MKLKIKPIISIIIIIYIPYEIKSTTTEGKRLKLRK